jgi:hypothetical protein
MLKFLKIKIHTGLMGGCADVFSKGGIVTIQQRVHQSPIHCEP